MATNLGDILLDMGVITPEILGEALRLQGRKLGEVLVEEGFAPKDQVLRALEAQVDQRSHRSFVRLPSSLIWDLAWYLEAAAPESALMGRLGHEFFVSFEGVRAKVDRTVTQYRSMFPKRDVQLDFHAPDWEVDRGIAREIEDILLHGIRNALAHGYREGVSLNVYASVAAQPGGISITIRDTGPGFADLADGKQLTFSRFGGKEDAFLPASNYGVPNAFAGMGLGLSTVKTICLSLGGTLILSNEQGAKGNGSGAKMTAFIPSAGVWARVVPVRSEGVWFGLSESSVARVEALGGDAMSKSTVTGGSNEPRISLAKAFGLTGAHVGGALERTRGSENLGSISLETARGGRWIVDDVDLPYKALVRIASAPVLPGISGVYRVKNQMGSSELTGFFLE